MSGGNPHIGGETVADSIIRQTTARYRPWPDLFYYAYGKVVLDPAYPAVARLLEGSSRPLLDIGCGMGLLASYLRACGHQPPITGLDVDERKIGVAREVLATDAAEFLARSALEFPAHQGDVVMLDVLHYFSDDEQKELLSQVAASVSPEGKALIRVTLREFSWRYALTWLEEWIVRASKWIPAKGWNFPTREEIVVPLRQAGLDVQVSPMWGFTPFNSYLIICERGLA